MNMDRSAAQEFLGWHLLERDYDMVPSKPPGGLHTGLWHGRSLTTRYWLLNTYMISVQMGAVEYPRVTAISANSRVPYIVVAA